MGVSLNPNEQIDAPKGGYLSKGDVAIKTMRWTTKDWGNWTGVQLSMDGTLEENGTVIDVGWNWGIGNADQFIPSKDGKVLDVTSEDVKITNNKDASYFFAELGNIGYENAKLEKGDVSCFDGMKVRFRELPDPSGRKRLNTKDGKEYVVTIPVIVEVLGEKGKSKKSKNKASEEVLSKTTDLILEIIAENGGKILKTKLVAALFKKVNKDDGDKDGIIGALSDKDFLGNGENGWEFDGKTLSL